VVYIFKKACLYGTNLGLKVEGRSSRLTRMPSQWAGLELMAWSVVQIVEVRRSYGIWDGFRK
jgi:hypothetical protein